MKCNANCKAITSGAAVCRDCAAEITILKSELATLKAENARLLATIRGRCATCGHRVPYLNGPAMTCDKMRERLGVLARGGYGPDTGCPDWTLGVAAQEAEQNAD